MIGELFLRQLPLALETGIRTGELQVYGSTIRHVANGQIAGFLQETSGLSKIASLVGNGPLAPLRLIGSGIQIAQGEQIKAGIGRLEEAVAMINRLQIANLALSAAGIGVTIAGVAIINHKINGLRRDVEALGDKLDRLLDATSQDRAEHLEDMIERLRGLSRQIDHRWTMTFERAAIGWYRDADEAAQLGAFFEGRARRMLERHPLGIEEVAPLLDAATMATGLRVGSLALSGEIGTAIDVAREDAKRLEAITGRIGAADLVRARLADLLPQSGDADAGQAIEQARVNARRVTVSLRNREASAATRAVPLIALQSSGMSARDWFSTAREEQEAPLLITTV
jgi:hypothetical protein